MASRQTAVARGPAVAAGLPREGAGLPGAVLAPRRLDNALDWTLCLASPRCPPGAHAEGTGAAALCPCYVLLSPLISL